MFESFEKIKASRFRRGSGKQLNISRLQSGRRSRTPQEGYRIDAITKEATALPATATYCPQKGSFLYTKGNMKVSVFKSVESTNLTAKKMALDGAPAGPSLSPKNRKRAEADWPQFLFPFRRHLRKLILRPPLSRGIGIDHHGGFGCRLQGN
jgi:hypothetical protein